MYSDRPDEPHTGDAGFTPLPDPWQAPGLYEGVALKRGLAWVVDALLISIAAGIVVPFTAFTALFYFPLLLLIVGLAYRTATLASGSATWGMRLMAIEIRSLDGRALDTQHAFLHSLGFVVCMALPLLQIASVIMMLAGARGQGLPDHLLGTTAVNRGLR